MAKKYDKSPGKIFPKSLGAILRVSTMGTAKARNPLQHGRLRDFSGQQNRAKNRFDHINDYRQEKL